MNERKTCDTCANSEWLDGMSVMSKACIDCRYRADGTPTNWAEKVEEHKAFCIHCGREQDYFTSSHYRVDRVRGIEFRYQEQTAKCRACGNEVYSPETNDASHRARVLAYEKAKRGAN